MRANLKILRNFYEYKPDHLVTFGGNISTNLDLVTFPNLTVKPTVIKTLVDDLSAKQGAMITGGPVEREARDTAFDALCAALDADADDVEKVVQQNMQMLLATGYLPASINHTSSPLDDTAINGLFNKRHHAGVAPVATGGQCRVVSGANQFGRRQDLAGGGHFQEGNPDCDHQPGSGHDVSGAGAGHRRQHGGEQLDGPRFHHVHVNGFTGGSVGPAARSISAQADATPFNFK